MDVQGRKWTAPCSSSLLDSKKNGILQLEATQDTFPFPSKASHGGLCSSERTTLEISWVLAVPLPWATSKEIRVLEEFPLCRLGHRRQSCQRSIHRRRVESIMEKGRICKHQKEVQKQLCMWLVMFCVTRGWTSANAGGCWSTRGIAIQASPFAPGFALRPLGEQGKEM